MPTCDCTLSSSRNIWVLAPDMEEYVRGESRNMLYVEHGSVLKFFLSQGTTWLRAAVATANISFRYSRLVHLIYIWKVFSLMMTDFQSVCIGLEAAQTLVFSDKVEFFQFLSRKKFALARGRTSSCKVGPSPASGPTANSPVSLSMFGT